MAVIKNSYLRALDEYLHDMAAGAFPGAVVAAWLIRRGMAGASADTILQLQKATTALWLVLGVCALVLIATGLGRLGYWHLNLRPEVVTTKRRMILIKHTAFVLTLIGCIIWIFSLLPA
jgi:hypothetical protein